VDALDAKVAPRVARPGALTFLPCLACIRLRRMVTRLERLAAPLASARCLASGPPRYVKPRFVFA
jgi:hypothetical protein